MTNKEQNEALKFLGSPRGQYIVGRALAMGVESLEKVDGALREISDIEDMKYLGEHVFKAGYVTHSVLSKELLTKIKEQLGNDPDKLIEDTELVQEINDEIKAINENGKQSN